MNDLSNADVLEETDTHRRLRLRGGLREGVEVIELRAGNAQVAVCPTRGMGLLSMSLGGTRAEWHSPAAGPVHPSLVNLDARGGLGWLDGFTELLVRCGLSFNGPPGDDEAAGPINRHVTLHGRIANAPARDVTVTTDDDGVSVSGVVDEATLFGSRLELHTTTHLSTGGTVTVTDRTLNAGGLPAEVQLLYHINVGRPFLGEGAKVRVSASDACPRDEAAAGGAEMWDVCGPPTAGFAEEAFFFKAADGADGRAVASLTSPDGERTFAVAFEASSLPCVTVWKCTQAEADGAVVGLEPGTGWPNFKAHERTAGRVLSLGPGESWETSLSLRILEGQQPDVGPRPVMLTTPAGW